MPQNTKVELTRELIKALLNESRQNAITPAQLAAIYKRIIDIVDEDAAERQQAVTDAQNAADAAEEALRKISEFASSRLVCNFGNMHISPALSGIELSSDADREKVSEAKSVIAAGGSIAGTIISTNAKGNDIRLNISTYRLYSPSAGDNRIQIEAVASDCTASNLRFYMMRVNFLFREDGKILYDSTPLRQIDIPVSSDFSFDPVTFSQEFNRITEKDLPVLMKFMGASNKYIDINIDNEKFIDAGSGPGIWLDRAFDIAEMFYVIDNMDGIRCNEYVAPVFLHSGDTIIGRFPAFFSRSREDEESYWQITGCALFEYKDTVWNFFINAVPENGDSEITLYDFHAAGSGSGTQTRTLQSSPFLQRGTFPLGANPGVYYRNNGYIKLTFPGRINLGKEDFTASWDLSKIDPVIFPGITGRVHVPPARAEITDLPLQPGDLVVSSFLELVHSVVYDTEKKILTASFTRNTYGEFVQSFRLCVANPRNYTGCDLNYIVKHADGTIHAVNGIRASEPSLPAPELKIGKLKDITTLEELILTAREQAGWIYGYELQRKTRIKRDLADGSSIHKTKWVRQKKLHGHRIGVFRIRFRTTRGSTGPWTVFSFCHKAGNKFRIL